MIIDEVWNKYVSTLYKVAQLSNKMNNYQIIKILGEGDGREQQVRGAFENGSS